MPTKDAFNRRKVIVPRLGFQGWQVIACSDPLKSPPRQYTRRRFRLPTPALGYSNPASSPSGAPRRISLRAAHSIDQSSLGARFRTSGRAHTIRRRRE
jgi:hypothetical protein